MRILSICRHGLSMAAASVRNSPEMASRRKFHSAFSSGRPADARQSRGYLVAMVTLFCATIAPVHGQATEERNLFRLLHAEKQIEVPGEDGRSEPYLLPAREIAVGEEVIYTVEFANDSGLEIERPVIICPFPDFMAYVPGTAVGPGAEVSFSIDGGRSFAQAHELKLSVDGVFETAPPERYTHVRWVLDRPLPPGARGFTRFRARRVPLVGEPAS